MAGARGSEAANRRYLDYVDRGRRRSGGIDQHDERIGRGMSEQRDGGNQSSRRRFITASAGTLVLALTHHEIAFGATLLAVRVWPAEDYTRVTLEHDGPLTFSHFMVRDPAHPLRLVVDIDGLDLTQTLKELVGKIEANDPYIALVRVGQNRPRVARLVIELKEDIKPQVFSLEPIGPHQHRLVLDLVADGTLDGIRIDHIDGLVDPCQRPNQSTLHSASIAKRSAHRVLRFAPSGCVLECLSADRRYRSPGRTTGDV